jgi:NADP-dependent 3-hydroxy acid dehydrogenase YdfG
MGRSLSGKTYWLVGASFGIGAALARELDSRGARLILTARTQNRLAEVSATLSHPPKIVLCDVTDSASVTQAADEAGGIDGVIYMAGDYDPMTAADWRSDRALRIAEVNFNGALRIFGAVVPAFAQRDRGHVVVVGSLAGFSGLPGAIGYGSSKAAIMQLAKDMRADLKKTGVRVQLVNPGFVDTRLTRKNGFRMPFIMTDDKAARIIANHMTSRRFSRSFPALFSWVFRLMGIGDLLRA